MTEKGDSFYDGCICFSLSCLIHFYSKHCSENSEAYILCKRENSVNEFWISRQVSVGQSMMQLTGKKGSGAASAAQATWTRTCIVCVHALLCLCLSQSGAVNEGCQRGSWEAALNATWNNLRPSRLMDLCGGVCGGVLSMRWQWHCSLTQSRWDQMLRIRKRKKKVFWTIRSIISSILV